MEDHLHPHIIHDRPELLPIDIASVALVRELEKVLNLNNPLLAGLQQFQDGLVIVIVVDLECVLDEHARNDIQHAEDSEDHIHHVEDPHEWVDLQQRLCHTCPVVATADAPKQSVDSQGQRAVELKHRRDHLGLGAVLDENVQLFAHELQYNYGVYVDHKHQEACGPQQGLAAHSNAGDHHAEVLEEPQHADETDRPCEPQDAQQADHRDVGAKVDEKADDVSHDCDHHQNKVEEVPLQVLVPPRHEVPALGQDPYDQLHREHSSERVVGDAEVQWHLGTHIPHSVIGLYTNAHSIQDDDNRQAQLEPRVGDQGQCRSPAAVVHDVYLIRAETPMVLLVSLLLLVQLSLLNCAVMVPRLCPRRAAQLRRSGPALLLVIRIR
mmetsp:Transcript_75062/g.207021  ORF Transcript_75062/g.207021 Transcript_75062/m.207021 type:complete len:381 (+) Transcript_75062:79-1221(+)